MASTYFYCSRVGDDDDAVDRREDAPVGHARDILARLANGGPQNSRNGQQGPNGHVRPCWPDDGTRSGAAAASVQSVRVVGPMRHSRCMAWWRELVPRRGAHPIGPWVFSVLITPSKNR